MKHGAGKPCGRGQEDAYRRYGFMRASFQSFLIRCGTPHGITSRGVESPWQRGDSADRRHPGPVGKPGGGPRDFPGISRAVAGVTDRTSVGSGIGIRQEKAGHSKGNCGIASAAVTRSREGVGASDGSGSPRGGGALKRLTVRKAAGRRRRAMPGESGEARECRCGRVGMTEDKRGAGEKDEKAEKAEKPAGRGRATGKTGEASERGWRVRRDWGK